MRPAAGCAHLSAVIAESQGSRPSRSAPAASVSSLTRGNRRPGGWSRRWRRSRCPHDGIGGDGDAVAGGAGPDGVADAVDDLPSRRGRRRTSRQRRPRRCPGRRWPRHPRLSARAAATPTAAKRRNQRGAADGGDRPGLHQAVHHLLLLLLGKVEPVHGIPIAVAHVIPSLSKSVRSCWRPRLSWVETVAGFSPRSWAISRAA